MGGVTFAIPPELQISKELGNHGKAEIDTATNNSPLQLTC
jgi:hypothetical protein